MDIAIVGAGTVGTAVGVAWARRLRDGIVGSEDFERAGGW